MAALIFDAVAFRTMFPAFANETKYPELVLSGYFDMATCNIGECENEVIWGKCLQTALYLMTAHIGSIFTMIASGAQMFAGVQTSATVDKVSVSATAPPFKSGWQSWLSKTPYGEQLWALLLGKSAGGFYIGAADESSSFRKSYGEY